MTLTDPLLKTPLDPYATAARMTQYGGSWVKALADCWYRADAKNKVRLEEAFAEEFGKYREETVNA